MPTFSKQHQHPLHIVHAQHSISTGSRRHEMTTSVDNEARGENAYDRIKAEARDPPRSQNYMNLQDKTHMRGKPMVRRYYPNRKTYSRHAINVQRSKKDSISRSEDEAIAETSSCSLANGSPPSSSSAFLTKIDARKTYEADIANAKRIFLSDESDEQHEFDHTPDLPYAPLRLLYDRLHTASRVLQAHAQRQENISPVRVWESVAEWQATVFSVVYDLEKAEEKRIKNINKRIDLDIAIENQNQKKLQDMNQMWETKMAAREAEWEAKMEAQRQMHQSKLVHHKSTKRSVSSEVQEQEQLTPTAALHVEPHLSMTQDENVRVLKVSQLTAIVKLESKHAKETTSLKEKLNRAHTDNETLRKSLQERESSNEHTDELKVPNKTSRTHAESKRGARRHRQAGQPNPTPRSDSRSSAGKRKRDSGDQSALEEAPSSPKTLRNSSHDGETH